MSRNNLKHAIAKQQQISAEQLVIELKPYMESLVDELKRSGVNFFDEYVTHIQKDSADILGYLTSDMAPTLNYVFHRSYEVLDRLDELKKQIEESVSKEGGNGPTDEDKTQVIEDSVIAKKGMETKPLYPGKVTVISAVTSFREAFDKYVKGETEGKDGKTKKDEEASFKDSVATTLTRVDKKTHRIDMKISKPIWKTLLDLATFMFLGGWFFKWAWPGLKPILHDMIEDSGINDALSGIDDKLRNDFPETYGYVRERLDDIKDFLVKFHDTITSTIKFIARTVRKLSPYEDKVEFWKDAYLDNGYDVTQSADSDWNRQAVAGAQAMHGYGNLDKKASQAALESIKWDSVTSSTATASIVGGIFEDPGAYAKATPSMHGSYNEEASAALRSLAYERDEGLTIEKAQDLKVYSNPDTGESFISNQTYHYITNLNNNVKSNLHQ